MKNRPFNVLVGEDDPATCVVLSTIFKRLGNNVEVAYDGEDAIALISGRPDHYDILMTDHRMPLVTGLELVYYLRKNEFEGKIIVISGFLTDELMTAYRDKQVDKILQKPFEINELTSILDTTLDKWG